MSDPVKIVVQEQPVRVCRATQSYLDGSYPFAMAHAYVDEDSGHLMMAVYGFESDDAFSIDNDGHLVLTQGE